MKNSFIMRYLILFMFLFICLIPFIWLLRFFDYNYFLNYNNDYQNNFSPLSHIGIIIDGTQRWSKKHELSLKEAYIETLNKFFSVIDLCNKERIKNLSFHLLTRDNYEKRTINELSALFSILFSELHKKEEWLMDNDICIRVYGELELLESCNNHNKDFTMKSIIAKREIDYFVNKTRNNKGLVCNLLLLYDSLDDLLYSVRKLIDEKRESNTITKKDLYFSMRTGPIPPIDLLICTGGMKRFIGFLPIQSIYSEIEFIDYMWPDFSLYHLKRLINQFSSRIRNFGY